MVSTERSKKSAEKRVLGFLQDYDEQWRRAAPAFEARDHTVDAFEVWRGLTQRVAREHFVDGAEDLSTSFGTPPEYGVAVERIVRSEVDADTAYVLTEVFGSPVDMFHEFTLRKSGFRWRIASIAQHFDDPVAPFASPADVRASLDATSTEMAFDPLPAPQLGLDEERNFTPRSVVFPGGEGPEVVTVEHVGTLVTDSGALSVIDFGYENDDARPLARRVAPGSYPVDRVTAAGRIAAVRVRFADRPAVSWHPASQRPGQGHVIGVDAGCVCVVDYPAYAGMSRRAKAERFAAFGARPRPSVGMFPLGEGQVGLATESGWGDGGYPVLWGLDADGAVVQLVVDFMVLVTDAEDGRLVHL